MYMYISSVLFFCICIKYYSIIHNNYCTVTVTATSYIEDTILHCCILNGFNPSGSLLHIIQSLVLLLQEQRVITVSGRYTTTKDIVRICIEVLKKVGHNVTVSNISIDTIGEEYLIGQQQLK